MIQHTFISVLGERRHVLMFASTILLAVGCVETAEPPPVPVVGVEGVSLYGDEDLSEEKAPLAPGIELAIVAEKGDNLEINTTSGAQGWVRRCWVCSLKEFHRRESDGHIPTKVVCIKSEDGRTLMYGGSLSIENGDIVMKPGDAFWMDPTMNGTEFTFGSQEVMGDPNVLLLTPESGDMIRLQIWSTPTRIRENSD